MDSISQEKTVSSIQLWVLNEMWVQGPQKGIKALSHFFSCSPGDASVGSPPNQARKLQCSLWPFHLHKATDSSKLSHDVANWLVANVVGPQVDNYPIGRRALSQC